MNRHAVDFDAAHERASATPAARQPRRSGDHRDASGRSQTRLPVDRTLARVANHSASTSPEPCSLRDAQTWFARAITTPESQPAAVSSEQASRLLTAGPRLDALERLEIYRRGYHARLLECLADDYPVVKHAIGDEAFDELGRAYIAAFPSAAPSLNFFGRHMALFCREAAPLPSPVCAFVAELASLEWAIVEVIHARESEALTTEGLAGVPAASWAAARLVPTQALRLLRFEHRVNEYFQAVRTGSDPPAPAPARSATIVYRSGPTVWRMDLTEPMFDVLSALLRGETLGDALTLAESALGELTEQEAAARVLGWFREWVGSGLFARIELA